MAEIPGKASEKDSKKRFVKAAFNYTPINVDELQLKVNDILEVLEETEEGWWKGVLNGNVGMFPSNFVHDFEEHPEEIMLNESSPMKTANKVANCHETVQQKDDDAQMQFNKDETKAVNTCSSSTDATEPNAPQFEIESDKKSLSFHKKGSSESGAPRLPPKPVREQARVIYPYVAMNEDELSLKEGDIITVISKEVEDKGWWKGELNSRTGVFPDNFVQLIKVEEQKKPERPDKPSIVCLKSTLNPEKGSESSPKSDKKTKTPPAKPPPPDIHRKEIERPQPPFSTNKPQLPYPIKKPNRPSISSKHPCYNPSALAGSDRVTSIENISIPNAISSTETKFDGQNPEKEDEKNCKGDLGFDNLEPAGNKLVHLTANRAKVPNRRPPSYIFLREDEKVNSSSSDPRRLSEPLLSEIQSVFQLSETDDSKMVKVPRLNDGKSKNVPSRPLPPNIKGNKLVGHGSVSFTETISSEECVIKAPEPIKKRVFSDQSASCVNVTIPNNKDCLSFDSSLELSANKTLEFKEKLKLLKETMVSKSEYDDLVKQVKQLQTDLEKYNSSHLKVISDLKAELEQERKFRISLETKVKDILEQHTI